MSTRRIIKRLGVENLRLIAGIYTKGHVFQQEQIKLYKRREEYF